jgi:hypothetical protein
MSRKARLRAFSSYNQQAGYTPGPDLDASPAPGIQADDDVYQYPVARRISDGIAPAVPFSQLTADQHLFRSQAFGRDGGFADPGVGAHAHVRSITRDPMTGCTDSTQLEPVYNPQGRDYYVDLGGKGGVDYAAGRP